jgi:hypothetical protein
MAKNGGYYNLSSELYNEIYNCISIITKAKTSPYINRSQFDL